MKGGAGEEGWVRCESESCGKWRETTMLSTWTQNIKRRKVAFTCVLVGKSWDVPCGYCKYLKLENPKGSPCDCPGAEEERLNSRKAGRTNNNNKVQKDEVEGEQKKEKRKAEEEEARRKAEEEEPRRKAKEEEARRKAEEKSKRQKEARIVKQREDIQKVSELDDSTAVDMIS